MKAIRNSHGKLVCRIDEQKKIVEIAVKGCVTTIHFTNDGKMQVLNTEKKI